LGAEGLAKNSRLEGRKEKPFRVLGEKAETTRQEEKEDKKRKVELLRRKRRELRGGGLAINSALSERFPYLLAGGEIAQ